MSPSISVVIPTRDEATHLPRLIRRLQALPHIGQIIVCDGGSLDQTCAIAREMGALVIESVRGRGPQQNAGALAASGEVLWFLHADCLPPRRADAQILRAIKNGASGGNFRIQFAARGLAPRTFEFISRAQRVRGLYYGDSGIWLTRGTWNKVGPFPTWPLFEDYALVRALEKHGPTACCAGRLQVSARRFATRPWRVLGLWLELQARFRLGQTPTELAQIYQQRCVNYSV